MTRYRDPVTGRFAKLAGPKTLTAAVSISEEQLDRVSRAADAWQSQAWNLWRLLGVLHYPTTFKAKQVGRLEWDVTVNGVQLEPEQATEAIEAVTQPLGTREVARRLALLFEVAGEAYYIRRRDVWEVIASTTPKRSELLREADLRIHEWSPDPENPNKPDSWVRSALGTLEAIRLMCAMSRAQDRNRLAQRGILLIPKEGQFPDDDPFLPKLEAAITAPIADEYSASAVVPPVVNFPAEFIEKWKHLVLESPYDDKLMARIEGEIRHLALQADMPAEILLGLSDVNHWNAWLSEESNYRAHTEPNGLLVGAVFAEAMMLATDGAAGEIVVLPNPKQLLARRQSVADAFEALRNLVVGFEYVRDAIGADEDDAPTPEEIELILKMQGLLSTEPEIPAQGTGSTTVGPPSVPGQAPEPVPAPSNGNGQVTAAVKDKRAAALDRLSRQLQAIDIQLLGHLKGAAELAAEHARERNDIGDGAVQENITEQMDKLGRSWRKQIDTTHATLNRLGISTDAPQWEEAAQASIDMLVDGMTAYVVENLEKPDSAVQAIPTLLLRQVLATAGGSGIATVAAVTANPTPTFKDPQGFAIGVLPLKGLKADGIEIVQWRFRYGPLTREEPFLEHKAVDGQFMTADGFTSEGWYPGDHKGCFLAGTTIEGPRSLAATLRDYEGAVIDLTLASGKLVSVTPNHPILTPQGWVPAGLLQEGGYVVGRFDSHRAASLIPDDYQAPAAIEDVVRSRHEAIGMVPSRVPVAAEDFHGDGVGSEVAVVAADRALWDELMTAFTKKVEHETFGWVEPPGSLSRLRNADPLGFWLRGTAFSRVGSSRVSPSLVGGHPRALGELSGAVAARLNTRSQKTATDNGTRDSETVTERELRLSRLVSADQIVDVHRYPYRGHVYNLQTLTGWYVAEGVIVHNCECGEDPVFRQVKTPDIEEDEE